jgi:hypothetical protein
MFIIIQVPCPSILCLTRKRSSAAEFAVFSAAWMAQHGAQ